MRTRQVQLRYPERLLTLLARYFETEITQDSHILNSDVERLEQEKIRLTILIRKLDARLKSLVTQVSTVVLALTKLVQR